MTEQQELVQRIRNAFRLFCRAEQAEGRRQLEEIWEELQPDGDAFARCLTAHFLADTESDREAELQWDLKALEVAQSVVVEDEKGATPPEVGAFLPSLHLNLADDYRKRADFPSARRHIKEGSARMGMLGVKDPYSQRVRMEMLRISAQIEDRDSGPTIVFDFD